MAINRVFDLINFNYKMLIKSEREFRAISEKAIDGILTIDDELTIVFNNRATEKIFDYKKDNLLNQSILKIFPFQSHAAILTNIDKLKNDPYDGGVRFEINGIKQSGKKVPIEISLSVNRYQNYQTYTAIIRDISTRKELEQQLKVYAEDLENLVDARTRELHEQNIALDDANKRLKELDQLKSNFLSNVSHELRTPLTSIKSSAKIINKYGAKKPESITKFSSIILEESERLTRLINNVLDLSKIEAGEMEFKLKNENIYKILAHIYNITNTIVDDKKIRYLIEIPKDLPEILVDKDAFTQVVVNLISNGVKFTEKGYIKIVIIPSSDRKKIKIIIKDSGIGIKKGDLEHVFEKFKQTGDTLTDKPKGTGLGLPISKEIIQKHGGMIWAESKLGKGSSFIFTIQTVLKDETNFDNVVKKKVLIISKNREDIEKIENIILKKQRQPISVQNFLVLKNILKKYQFELIIFDDRYLSKKDILSNIERDKDNYKNRIFPISLYLT